MSSILHTNYLEGLIGFIFFAIIFHFSAKSFGKDKFKRKEEFEKHLTENLLTKKEDYNHKRYLMDISALRYKGFNIVKWMMVIGACISMYKLMF